jgi:hypothetical protein
LERTRNATIAVIREVITLIDVLTVEPGDPAKLLESLRQNADRVVSNKRRVVIYSQWHHLQCTPLRVTTRTAR